MTDMYRRVEMNRLVTLCHLRAAQYVCTAIRSSGEGDGATEGAFKRETKRNSRTPPRRRAGQGDRRSGEFPMAGPTLPSTPRTN